MPDPRDPQDWTHQTLDVHNLGRMPPPPSAPPAADPRALLSGQRFRPTPPPDAPPRVTIGSAFGAIGNVTQAPMGAALGSLIDRPGQLGPAASAAWDTLTSVPPTVFEGAAPLTSPAEALRSRGVDIGPGLGLYTDLMADPLSLTMGDPLTAAGKLAVTGAEHVPQLVRGAKGLVEGAMQTARTASEEHAAGRFLADFLTNDTGAVKLPDLGTTGPPPAPPDRGLYSRLDELAANLPARGVHPNKLAGLVKSGASQEEVAYRQIPEFLASHGDQPVLPERLRAHLDAHPAPMPQTKVLGEPPPRVPTYNEYVDQLEQKYGVGYDEAHLAPEEQAQVRRLWQRYQAGDENVSPKPVAPTKYGSYSLPGAEPNSYREHLYTLPPKLEKQGIYNVELQHPDGTISRYPGQPADIVADFRRQYPGWTIRAEEIATPTLNTYRSGHFDQPNILAHARTTERTLPAQGMRDLQDIEEIVSRVRRDRALTPEQRIGSGPWQHAQDQGLITPDEAALYAQSRGYAGVQPPGSRGRFIEEIQSDWHQAGKRSGYATPLPPEAQARLAQLPQEIASAQHMVSGHNQLVQQASNAYLDALREGARSRLPPEYQHLTSFSDAIQRGEPAVEAWRAAREQVHPTPALAELRQAEQEADLRLQGAVNRLSTLQEEHGNLLKPSGVPDAPFKDTWPDLALKQQLLDVARDPHANWLGFTSGKTQAERYDLSKQVSRIEYNPERQILRAYDLDGSEVIQKHDVAPTALPDVIGKEASDRLLQSPIAWRGGQEGYGDAIHRLEGVHLQVGGEGMHHFYDQLLPKRLQKLLKPFGGTVEPFQLPTSKKTMDIDVPAFSVRDQAGNMRGIWENRADAEAYLANPPDFIDPARSTIVPATTVRTQQVQATAPSWIARLTPEMKRRILERGFPLLTVPPVLGAAALEALRQGHARDQRGAPPPAPPTPES